MGRLEEGLNALKAFADRPIDSADKINQNLSEREQARTVPKGLFETGSQREARQAIVNKAAADKVKNLKEEDAEVQKARGKAAGGMVRRGYGKARGC